MKLEHLEASIWCWEMKTVGSLAFVSEILKVHCLNFILPCFDWWLIQSLCLITTGFESLYLTIKRLNLTYLGLQLGRLLDWRRIQTRRTWNSFVALELLKEVDQRLLPPDCLVHFLSMPSSPAVERAMSRQQLLLPKVGSMLLRCPLFFETQRRP